jgi:hypothetical protein
VQLGDKRTDDGEKLMESERAKKVPRPLDSMQTMMMMMMMMMKFKDLTAASMRTAVFWFVAPCSLVQGHRHFNDACCLYKGLMKGAVSISETSVKFYQTAERNNTEYRRIHVDVDQDEF